MTIKISELANLTVVQANTIVPVVSNITGTLTTVQANIQQLQNYIVANGVSANITALYTNAATQSDLIIGINANLTQANLGMHGYVDQQILITSSAAANANVALKGYVDFANTIQADAISAANVGIIGYINLSNVNMKTYVDGQITAANAGVTAANVGMLGYVDRGNTIVTAGIITANIGMKGYVDNQTYSNVQTSAFLTAELPDYEGNIGVNVNITNGTVTATNFVGNGALLTGISGGISSYSNVQVATYLPTYSGNIANITIGSSGILTFADGTTQTTASAGGSSNYSNVNVKAYTESMGFQNFGNVNVAAYVTTANSAILGYIDQANTIQSAQINAANLAITAANLGMKGYVDSVASQSIYGNANVLSYLTGGFDGNIIPSANVTYSLGSSTNQWKDLWVSGNTINIGGTALSITGNSLSINGSKISTQKSKPANVEGAVGDTIGDTAYDTISTGNAATIVYSYYCYQTFVGVITYSDIRGVSGGSASAVLRVQTTHPNPIYAFPQAANVRVGWTMEGGNISGIATITSIQASSSGSPVTYYYEYTIDQAVDLRDATGITVKGRPAIWVRSTMSGW